MEVVYIETSIPSFYYETRQEPDMIARRDWTRRWWDQYAADYELVTSVGVINELRQGEYKTREAALELVANLRQLDVTKDVDDIIEVYHIHHLMPKGYSGDALHLALSSYYRCHFLLTWNCSHIANANKFRHIRTINARLGLFVPVLITPIEFMRMLHHD